MRFILENPLILVILIGVISSFIKKKKETQPERKKVVKPLKPLVRTEGTATPLSKNRPARAEKVNNEHATVPQQAIVLRERNQTHQDEKAASNKTLNTAPEALIDGLIWSEVLGPPRAKRPHRTIK